jgi:hypothetical protein
MKRWTKILSGKRRNAQQKPIQDFWREDCETSRRNFWQVTKNKEMGLVERQAPSETQKGISGRAGAAVM